MIFYALQSPDMKYGFVNRQLGGLCRLGHEDVRADSRCLPVASEFSSFDFDYSTFQNVDGDGFFSQHHANEWRVCG